MYQQGKPEVEYDEKWKFSFSPAFDWNGSKCLVSEEVKISDLTI